MSLKPHHCRRSQDAIKKAETVVEVAHQMFAHPKYTHMTFLRLFNSEQT